MSSPVSLAGLELAGSKTWNSACVARLCISWRILVQIQALPLPHLPNVFARPEHLHQVRRNPFVRLVIIGDDMAYVGFLVQTDSELYRLAVDVADAKAVLRDAEEAVSRDKALRQHSLLARLYDWLFKTPAERIQSMAQESLDQALQRGREAASAWVMNEAIRCLGNNASDSKRHADQLVTVNRLHQRARVTASWYQLSMEAQQALDGAASACASASNTEMLDMFSKSKTVSMMSTIDTSHAASSVRKANRAVQVLAEALPKRASGSDIQAPDDLIDLVVDLSGVMDFDLLSFLNVGKLDSAARACRKAAAELGPTHEKLHRASLEAQRRFDEAKSEQRAIEVPYLEAVTALVPSAIRCAVPAGFGVSVVKSQNVKSA